MKTKFALSLFSALGVLISLNAQSYPPDGWRVWMTIENAVGSQKYPSIASSENTIHVIWVDNRSQPSKVYYKRSNDLGFTWSEGVPICAPNDAIVDAKRNIGIACIANYVYVVYGTCANPTLGDYAVCFVRSTDGGITWGNHQVIESGLDSPPEPTIVASDSVRIVYRKHTGSSVDLIYRASGDNGITWSDEDYVGYHCDDHYPHLALVNNVPHVVFIRPHVGQGTYLVLHARPAQPVWEKSQIMNFGSYQYPLLVVDQENRLHAIWERTDYSVWYARSLNNGASWENIAQIFEGSLSSYVTSYHKGILIVAQSDNKIVGRLSPDFGVNWENPFVIDGQADAYEANCYIISGNNARHLVYQKLITNPDDYDLAYIANDDLLLSDDNQTTAFNNGRHFIRDPLTNTLHLVYFSQGRPHYTKSTDNGQTWAPYHIIENVHFAPQTKDSGYYPSIGLHPGILTAQHPCVVYIDNEKNVEYRYYDDWSGEWKGFTIISYSQTGLEPGPPSVYTYGDQVFVVFSVMNWVGSPLYEFISAVYFYQFTYNATNPGNPVILDQTTNNALYESRPTIVVDGNGNPHVAWDKESTPNRDIFYRWRNDTGWLPPLTDPPRRISEQTPNYADKSPHIDCYGPWLSVVWYDEISGVPNEIQRRRKYIPMDRWFLVETPPYSQSPGTASEFPVNAAHDFSVWCEIGNLNDYDIRYRSDTYGFGWVSQEPEREYFCHSQLQRDYYPWDLYTIFTKGNTTPYQIVCVHQQFGGGPPGGESPLYVVETGQDSLSPFCLHRDGKITYNNYSVDYANSELTYELSFLDPTFPFHKIKGTAYFEGTGNKTYELWINNTKKKTIVVKANEAHNFVIPIPKELYQNTHKITLSIKNPQANGVYLSNLDIHRLTNQTGGGPQSSNNTKLENISTLIVTPNPFKEETVIRYKITGDLPLSVKIYDATGRLVKRFEILDRPLSDQITWDGCDDTKRHLPNGIYFLELKSANKTFTTHIILLR